MACATALGKSYCTVYATVQIDPPAGYKANIDIDIEHYYTLTSLSLGSYFEVIFHLSLVGRTVCAAFLLNFVDKLRIFHYSHVKPFMTPSDAAS